jgi:multidrug efflux pump
MPMGIAIIGGLVIGTALTLYVIPSVYPWITRKELAPVIEEAYAGDGAAVVADALPSTQPATA